jgi:hypothetical protein
MQQYVLNGRRNCGAVWRFSALENLEHARLSRAYLSGQSPAIFLRIRGGVRLAAHKFNINDRTQPALWVEAPIPVPIQTTFVELCCYLANSVSHQKVADLQLQIILDAATDPAPIWRMRTVLYCSARFQLVTTISTPQRSYGLRGSTLCS